MQKFKLVSKFKPKGDQVKAIDLLHESIKNKRKHQVLLGVTGSGKTFTLANVIKKLNKPTLVVAPNKTLAAQLYEEFSEFFPSNSVQYFVSYYDFYQPEAYIPSTDIYIEKDSQINEEIDRLRHASTRSLLTRNDVIIVASVSCIYGLGSPEFYKQLHLELALGMNIKRDNILEQLVNIRYERNDADFHRGSFRVTGDTIDIFPAHEKEQAIRVELFGDYIDAITEIDPIRGFPIQKINHASIFPASHYITESQIRKRAIQTILKELRERLGQLKYANKELEYQRLEQRTLYDLEMIQEIGYCQGIENYSRHLTGREEGEAPPTLIDYFPKDFLMIIDESHVSVPQIGGMYKGDRARKSTLVEHGFRLKSALDNRPLSFEEFEHKLLEKSSSIVYVSATPASYELQKSEGEIIEQIIRPTGLLDPITYVQPAKNQIDNLIKEIKKRTKDEKNKTRVLVTVLTKKFAEDLTRFLLERKIKVKYLHSDVETLERIEILRGLRLGEFDVLVGINLLREGLDLPEVSLVAIMDADKKGFLRSDRSLIQTIGRAARNENGTVILYADSISESMHTAIKETSRRRKIQEEHNKKHNIIPKTIIKNIGRGPIEKLDKRKYSREESYLEEFKQIKNKNDIQILMKEIHKNMLEAAESKDFENAAKYRDKMKRLEKFELYLTQSI